MTISKFMRALVVSLTVGYVGIVSAGNPMKDVFDGVMTNSTDAGSFSTKNRWGASGGGISIRVPNVRPKIIAVVPPRVAASCGGMDFFLGSFSIINKDQLVQVMRGIANGAATYAFNLGMSAVCATCATYLNSLADKLNSMNQHLQDSCSASYNALASGSLGLPGMAQAAENSLWKPKAVELGQFSDAGSATASSTSAIEALGKGNPAAVKEQERNVLWSLMTKQQVNNWTIGTFTATSGTQSVSWQEMMMSLIGTVVFRFDANAHGTGNADLVPTPYSTGTTIKDLIKPESSTVKFLTCSDGAASAKCLDVQTKTINNWSGLEDSIYSKLLEIQPKLRARSGITEEDKKFLAFIGTDYISVLESNDTSELPDVLRALSQELAAQIVGGVVEGLAKEFSRTLNTSMENMDQAFRDELKERFAQLKVDSRQAAENAKQAMDSVAAHKVVASFLRKKGA
ncbi:TPA: conjugal transfer protein TraH [Salmonella enterica]